MLGGTHCPKAARELKTHWNFVNNGIWLYVAITNTELYCSWKKENTFHVVFCEIFSSLFENIYITHVLSRCYKLDISFFLCQEDRMWINNLGVNSSSMVSVCAKPVYFFFYTLKKFIKFKMSLLFSLPCDWTSSAPTGFLNMAVTALFMSRHMLLQEDSTEVKEHHRGTLGGFVSSSIKFNWD